MLWLMNLGFAAGPYVAPSPWTDITDTTTTWTETVDETTTWTDITDQSTTWTET